MNYIVYTDGSSIKKENIRYGGIGIYFETTGHELSIGFSNDNPTNQKMELLACLTAIEEYVRLYNNSETSLTIRTDSMYTINSITKWAKNWEQNNWHRKQKNTICLISNLAIIKQLYAYYNTLDIKFEHVLAHQKAPKTNVTDYAKWYGNAQADKLATEASKKIDNKIISNNK